MQLKSISLSVLALLMVFSTACSKKASTSEGPGRQVDVVEGDNDGFDLEEDEVDVDPNDDIEDVDRGGEDEIDEEEVEEVSQNTNNILFTNYRNEIPTTRVCTNVLEGRSAATLKKFFAWDVVNLEGPVTVCIEQETAVASCPNGESYCNKYVNKHVRIRIEYEDDLRFWYYDSEKSTNLAKLLSYTGGAGASNLELILMDGAGFLMIDGYKTASGKYSVDFSFADRPSYVAARAYDTARGFTSTSPSRRAASYADMKACATSIGGAAKFSDGTDCAGRFVLPYQFYSNLDTYYFDNVIAPALAASPSRVIPALITDFDLFVKNQITLARQYVKNQFPTHFTSVGVVGGSFGRLTLNGH